MEKRFNKIYILKFLIILKAIAGIIGGSLSTWNQPFEVMRIEAQSSAAKGNAPKSFVNTFHHIVKESGYIGLFQGIGNFDLLLLIYFFCKNINIRYL